jgi:hypothetical protein
VIGVDQRVALDLDELPMDVFELANQGLEVESLTAGHGTTQMAASWVLVSAAAVLHKFGDPGHLW